MRLYLDDLRAPYREWTLARTVTEAIQLCLNNEITHFSLDHDMGLECCGCGIETDPEDYPYVCCECGAKIQLAPTGMDFLKWVHLNNKWPPNKPLVHSANPVGAKNMRDFINDFYPVLKP